MTKRVVIDDAMVERFLKVIVRNGWRVLDETPAQARKTLEELLNPPEPIYAITAVFGQIKLTYDGNVWIENGEITLPNGERRWWGRGPLSQFETWCSEQKASVSAPSLIYRHHRRGDLTLLANGHVNGFRPHRRSTDT